MASALIDRLIHHCHIVNIRGNSYRMRHHTELWRSLQDPEPEKKTIKTRKEAAATL